TGIQPLKDPNGNCGKECIAGCNVTLQAAACLCKMPLVLVEGLKSPAAIEIIQFFFGRNINRRMTAQMMCQPGCAGLSGADSDEIGQYSTRPAFSDVGFIRKPDPGR